MKKLLITTVLATLIATPIFAQTSTVGVMIGASESAEHGLKIGLDHSAREIFFSTELEPETIFKLKAGTVNTTNEFDLASNDQVTSKGNIDYVEALVEYRFSEVYGSTSLFAGPGYFRQHFGGYEESNYGFAGGVNGIFPMTRRSAFLAEIAYHAARFDRRRAFLTVTGGVQFGF
jgi:hypothetical protein